MDDNNAREFTVRLQDLLRREQGALAELLVALADFDERRLWVELGYASLFDFLHRELGLSKSSASFRKRATELIRLFPEIVDPLRDGRLCLSSIFELGKVLTPENRAEVLPRFFELGKREAKVVAAELRPDPAPLRKTTITPVRLPIAAAPAETREPVSSLKVVCPAKPAHANSTPTPQEDRAPVPSPRREAACAPLTSDLSRLGITVSRRFLEKLEAARAALSHSHPGASADEILEAGLDLLLERHARRKGLVKRPRAEPAPSSDDHVPAHVSRAVWERDGRRCQWPVSGGGVCGSMLRPQLDHVVPRACGGPSTIDNLRILCAFHNAVAACEVYGDAWMDGYPRPRRGAAAPVDASSAPPEPPSGPGLDACPASATMPA